MSRKSLLFVVLGAVILGGVGVIVIMKLREPVLPHPRDQPGKDAIPEDRSELEIDVPPGTILTIGGQKLPEPARKSLQ